MNEEASVAVAGQLGTRWIRMERRLDASASRAYRAWSDPEELGRWLAPQLNGNLAPGARTWLLWPHTQEWWDVVEATASSRFAFRRAWQPGEAVATMTQLTFVPVGYGCLVQVEDGPFPLDAPGGLDAWAQALQTWAETLVMLRAYLDFSVDVRPHR